ncbi:septal ring lytic transglycosylase RlpA family protein [candidate division WOR-3 bacterium]|nr:septal ring lytic transglycosylase RlpA family protein [candidate division WOR-3 bacterium]
MILILFLLSLFCVDCSSCCCLGGGSGFSQVQYGEASYYAGEFHGRKTASGENYDMHQLTCAHKTLPFNTKVKVTNLTNKKTVIVRVNDRGPFVSGRIIDLSFAAAQKIDLIPSGVTRVKIEVIQ